MRGEGRERERKRKDEALSRRTSGLERERVHAAGASGVREGASEGEEGGVVGERRQEAGIRGRGRARKKSDRGRRAEEAISAQ